MLLFNRIRNDRRRSSLGETGTHAGAGAVPLGTGGSRVGGDHAPLRSRSRRAIMGRMPNVALPWKRKGENRPASGVRLTPTTPGGGPGAAPSAQDLDDPMESFAPVTDNAQDGAILQDEVPGIIADKIQKHHELWYHLAYRRPRDRRVSGGYALQPARLDGKPLPRPNPKRTDMSGLTHIASWKSRPRLWSDIGSPIACADGHKQVTSIDYGNAHEVVLSHTQESGEDIMTPEDTLPDGSPKYMLHPYDKRKVIWDLFVAVLIVYGCINIPLRIGFDLPTSIGQIITDSFIDVVFLLDMVLSFRTSYLAPDGEPVTTPGDIAVRYLKGSFLIDLCSTVPVDLIMLAVGGTGGLLRSTKLLRTLRLLRLARLMKLSKLGGKEDDLKNFLHPSLWALIKMLVSLIFIAHIMGCMWNWLILLSPDEQTWATAYGVADTSWGHRYLVGVYWAFTTMTTVGYGDITSASDLERGFAIVGMIIGATVFGYIIGNVAVIMENFNVVDAIENGKMNQIKDWLYDRKFPPALADKIRRQYRYIFTEVGVFDNTEIVDAMPGVMATSLLYAQHRTVAKGVGFLAKRPPVLVSRLLRKMVPCFANIGDVLYLEHEVGGHWYILRSGTISFYVSMSPLETQSEVKLMRSLSEDGNFGLTPVLLNVLNNETAATTAAAELLTVRKDDLVDILRQWPEVMAELTMEAERHFEAVKAFRAANKSAGIELQYPSSLSPHSKPKAKTKTLRGSPAKSCETNVSESPATDIAHPRALSEAVSGAVVGGPVKSMEPVGAKTSGDNMGSNNGGGGGIFFRVDEYKEAEAGEYHADVGGSSAGDNVAEESSLATGAARRERPRMTSEGLAIVDEGDEEGGNRSSSSSTDQEERPRHSSGDPLPGRPSESSLHPSQRNKEDDIERGSGGPAGGGGEGEGEKAGVRDGGKGRDKDSPVAWQATPAPAPAAAIATGPSDSIRSAEGTATRGRATKRPPPILTQDVSPTILGTPASELHRATSIDSSDDDNDGANQGSDSGMNPEKMRRCFVAKTFSPSDLGLGALNRGSDASEEVIKASLMRARRRRRTIDKGIGGIEGRRHTVDEVLGLDAQQAVLGSVAPERLFSITGMFHPDAPVKVSWDLWLSMVIVWSVLEVTYRLGFDQPARNGWVILSYSVDLLFFADMLVSFRTALLKRDGGVVASQKQVAIAYLQGWFLVDLISTVPWDLLVLNLAVGNANAATSTKLVRSLRLVRLLRLIRLLKIPDFMEEWEDNSPLGPSSVKLGRLLIIMAFSAHVNACIWYAAGLHTAAEHNWISDYYCSEDGISVDCSDSKGSFSLYLTSIYFAFTTMTTTGYGDIIPNRLSVLELLVAIASEVLGATIFAWVIGNLVALVLNLDPAERNRKSMMNYLTEYIREVPLNSKAKQAMARNYAFHLQIHSVFNQPSILGDLVPHLQNRAYVFLWRSLMPKLPFFCAMEDQVTGFVRVVLPLLKPATFALGEVIITPKIGTREMCFITSGEVEVRLAKGRRNFKTMTMGERKHFGEMFMLLPEHVPFRGLAQVRAMSRVRMMTLSRTALSELEDRHPHISDFMAKQLYEPNKTPLWVVVNADFQCEVDKLEANTMLSDFRTLETPRSPEGSFLKPVSRQDELGGTTMKTPGGSIKVRTRAPGSRSPSSSPIGVAKPREPAMRQVVGGVGLTKASRMASARTLAPHGRQ